MDICAAEQGYRAYRRVCRLADELRSTGDLASQRLANRLGILINCLSFEKPFEQVVVETEEIRRTCEQAGEPMGGDLPVSALEDLRVYARELGHARESYNEGVLADVYQAAIAIVGLEVVSGRERYFRGQFDSRWPLVPKFYRKAELPRRADNLRRIGAFVSKLSEAVPGRPEEEYLAIAQHYSSEARLATWLLDVSSDPLSALFFASHDSFRLSEPEATGVVYSFSRSEWDRLWPPIGGAGVFREIAPDVPRVRAQRGLFLWGCHPELVGQYSPMTVEFRQRPGLVFVDESLGISSAHFYGSQPDPFSEMATSFGRQLDVSSTRGIEPPASMDEPHEKELYRRLLDAWTKPREEERQRGDASRFLLALGDFHQRMVVGTRDREIARKPSIWSLEKTLWAAVLAIESGRTPPFSVLTQSEYVFPFSRDSPLFQLWLDALKESGLLALENQVNRDETDGKDDDS